MPQTLLDRDGPDTIRMSVQEARRLGEDLVFQSNGPALWARLQAALRQLMMRLWRLNALDGATRAVGARVPHEMLLLDLYGALRPLDEITGATTTDDILNLIFGTFCIGK